MILHAGLMGLFDHGRWRGALIEGVSGSGKSDLALRLIEGGWRLVADDRTQIWASGGNLYGKAPEVLSGKMEVRGLDVICERALSYCRIELRVIDGAPERMPKPEQFSFCGLKLRGLTLPLLETSAAAKIAHAMRHLGADDEGAYLGVRAGANSPLSGGDSR